MGITHDSFITEPDLRCPLDGEPLENRLDPARGLDAWQGHSGPGELRLYRQGSATFERTSLADLETPEGGRSPMSDSGLPARFELINVCGDHKVVAEGRLGADGIWTETQLLFVLGPDRSGERFFSDDPVWGVRPAEPLWPEDAAVQLRHRLEAAGLGPVSISTVHHQGALTAFVDPRLDAERLALIPPRFAGHEVVIVRARDGENEEFADEDLGGLLGDEPGARRSERIDAVPAERDRIHARWLTRRARGGPDQDWTEGQCGGCRFYLRLASRLGADWGGLRQWGLCARRVRALRARRLRRLCRGRLVAELDATRPGRRGAQAATVNRIWPKV